jgi:hypothetical protein
MPDHRLVSADSHVGVDGEVLDSEVSARQFAAIPAAERELICCGNATRVYGL